MDSTMSHEVLNKFAEVDARLDALESKPGGKPTEEDDIYVEEEEV